MIGGYLIIPDPWSEALGKVFNERTTVSISYPEAADDYNRILNSNKPIFSSAIRAGVIKTSPIILMSSVKGASSFIAVFSPVDVQVVIIFNEGKITFKVEQGA